jgi:phosphate/sulfate permease
MPRSKPDLENQKSSSSGESIKERGNHIIVSAAGGSFVGAVLATMGLPVVVTSAVVGAIAGAAIAYLSSDTESTYEEVTTEDEDDT